MKIQFDESFEILNRNRKLLHQRRTVSSVLDLSNTSIHNKSFSSQLPSISEDLNIEIQKIKDEVKERCLQQQRREIVFNSIIAAEFALQTEDVRIEADEKLFEPESPSRSSKGFWHYMQKCLKCLKFDK
jgi:hypothetical protein